MVISPFSVKSLFLQMRFNGQDLATGTGFIAYAGDKPVLITNRHNVTGRNQYDGKPMSKTGGIPNEIVVFHNSSDGLGTWIPIVEPLFSTDGDTDLPQWREHPTLGKDADFVALPLTKLEGVKLYAYDLNNLGADLLLGPADVLSVVGFPFGKSAGGLCAVWATGFIASEPDLDFEGRPKLLIDCRSRPGQSGSPVIAHRTGGAVALRDGSTAIYGGSVCQLIGIYSGRINEQSDLGIVWKASAIKELIDNM